MAPVFALFRDVQASSNPGYLMSRPCPVCGADNARSILEIQNVQFYTDSADPTKRVDVRQVQCRHCLTLYMNPAYSNQGFEVLFAQAGKSYGDGPSRPGEQVEWLAAHGCLNDGKAVMDIGSFEGDFLARLPITGPRIGIEFDQGAVERAKERHADAAFQFIQGRFEDFEFDGDVDCFTMFHVLEHLPDPVAVLKKLRQHANSDTALIVEVPIVEQGDTNDIHGFFSSQHLTHFSRNTLASALARAGWRIEDAISISTYNGYRVLARPVEPSDSAHPDFTDQEALRGIMASWQIAIRDMERRLDGLLTDDCARVVIWGGGFHTEILYQHTSFFERLAEIPIAIVDGDASKQGQSWRGVPIGVPDQIEDIDWRDTTLVVSSYGSQYKIRDVAVTLGVPEEAIILLYDSLKIY